MSTKPGAIQSITAIRTSGLAELFVNSNEINQRVRRTESTESQPRFFDRID